MIIWDTADLGSPCLDLVAFFRGRCLPVEVKQPGMENSLTDSEWDSIKALRAVGVEVVIATCAEDVLLAFDELVQKI